VDYEKQLVDSRLGDPVVVIPSDFEARMARAETPVVEVLASAGNARAQAAVGRIVRVLEGFNREQATLRLAVRGVSPALLQAMEIDERDLAAPASRAAQLAVMVPYFVLMAMLYGALNAALDTTAGERERGSLEPLLMNPASRWAMVLGKWGAVAGVGMLIAMLSCLSFLPGQWLLRSETLAALFQFGFRQALSFILVLLPLAAALGALLMAIAIRCKSFKEAQANATIVMLAVALLPLISLFGQDGEATWYRFVPALAQITLMGHALKGEASSLPQVWVPVAVCAAITAASLGFVVRVLRSAALR
jgi:sodium transport system permease protein